MFKRLVVFLLFCSPLLATAQHTSDFDSEAEKEIIRLINKERTERGLPALATDERLTRAARTHTELMVKRHELSHRLTDEAVLRERVAVTGLAFDAAGENVAYDANVEHAHVEFMHSPGHRANILQTRFNSVGVGIVHSGSLIWVTEDFAQRMGVTTASEAATIVKKKFAELRRSSGSPPASEHTLGDLGEIACNMAKKDRLDTQSARRIAGVHEVMAWTASDPAELPKQVKAMADDRGATKYSLGVCYAASASNPNKIFWMVMALY